MGRIKKGILGGFSGKVGTVVGANWKSISYMRSLAQNVKNPRTPGQLKQRSKIALVVSLLKQLTAALRIGWKLHAKKQSAFNAATKYALANAIKGTFPNFQIDYPKVMISQGSLPTLQKTMLAANLSRLTLNWENNSGIGAAKPTDKLLFVAVNTNKGENLIITDAAERSDGSYQLTVPQWVGSNFVYVYAGFVSEDGKEVSNSCCMGPVTVTNT